MERNRRGGPYSLRDCGQQRWTGGQRRTERAWPLSRPRTTTNAVQSTGGGRNACGVKVAMATVGGRVEKAWLVRCRLYIIDQVWSLSPSRSPPPPPLSLSLSLSVAWHCCRLLSTGGCVGTWDETNGSFVGRISSNGWTMIQKTGK